MGDIRSNLFIELTKTNSYEKMESCNDELSRRID